MSRNAIITIVLIIMFILGGWYILKPRYGSGPAPGVSSPAPVESAPSATKGAEVKEGSVVTISASGFSPKDITIKAGSSVTWRNQDTADHAVNSAVHPTHLKYPPLNLGVVKPGESKSLTFPSAGTYRYHDHLNPSLFGSVTVQ